MQTKRSKFHRSPLWLATAVLALTSLVAAGCGGGDDSTSADSSEPIKIGVSLPLTGDFSQPGVAAKQGYEIWPDPVNKQGGLLGSQVELDIKDDAERSERGRRRLQRADQQEKVDLLLGTFSSLLESPGVVGCRKDQDALRRARRRSPEIFERRFKYLFFAQQATAHHQADLFAE